MLEHGRGHRGGKTKVCLAQFDLKCHQHQHQHQQTSSASASAKIFRKDHKQTSWASAKAKIMSKDHEQRSWASASASAPRTQPGWCSRERRACWGVFSQVSSPNIGNLEIMMIIVKALKYLPSYIVGFLTTLKDKIKSCFTFHSSFFYCPCTKRLVCCKEPEPSI